MGEARPLDAIASDRLPGRRPGQTPGGQQSATVQAGAGGPPKIRAHFGLQKNPFTAETFTLLAHQQEIFDILKVHAQQGGLCLVLGEPGTGKSVLKDALLAHDPKRLITPVVNRTLHTYHNTLRILCSAFQIEFNGQDHHCDEARQRGDGAALSTAKGESQTFASRRCTRGGL
jgi:type II secretory pathway predicted ATPase ExeA